MQILYDDDDDDDDICITFIAQIADTDTTK